MSCPLYLFTGPEFGERNDAIKTLHDQAKKQYGELDDYSFYASDTSISDVISLLQNESLFASGRFVVLKNTELIKKKEDIELISDWLKECTKKSSSTKSSGAFVCSSILVLVSDDIGIDKKLENLVAKENKRIFWEMFEDRKEQWLFTFFKKAGYNLEEDAASAILELVENNTEALRNECSRFFSCFEKGHTITEADVDAILAHNREETPFSLFYAMSNPEQSPQHRLESSLSILQKLLLSKGGSAVQVVTVLAYCFRKLGVYHSLCSDGVRPDDFTLKINGIAGKKAQTNYKNAARIWNNRQTSSIIALLAKQDMELRATGTATEDTITQTLLYSIIIRNGSPLASSPSFD